MLTDFNSMALLVIIQFQIFVPYGILIGTLGGNWKQWKLKLEIETGIIISVH